MSSPSRWNGVRLAGTASIAVLAGCLGVRHPGGPLGAGGKGGPAAACIDLDGDGYGLNCPLGPDCNDHDPTTRSCTGIGPIVIDPGWVPTPDAGAPDVFVPPATETPTCPSGTRRIHVKDLWSTDVDPTLGVFSSPPLAVVISDVTHNWLVHNARKDATSCAWYSDCLPTTTTAVTVAAVDPTTGCVGNQTSGSIDISGFPATPGRRTRRPA